MNGIIRENSRSRAVRVDFGSMITGIMSLSHKSGIMSAAVAKSDKTPLCACKERPLLGQAFITAYDVDSNSVQTVINYYSNFELWKSCEIQRKKEMYFIHNNCGKEI